jgi:hypothetical protein
VFSVIGPPVANPFIGHVLRHLSGDPPMPASPTGTKS